MGSMENINGALAFKATLDIDDFNVSGDAMERRIKQVSSSTIAESAQMEQSIQSFAKNGAKYIVAYLVGQGMGSLVQSIVQTRGQFQQLEIAFGTMLKSSAKAKTLMDELVMVAAKTPFDLQGVASSAKQLMAYGASVDNVVDELIMLGNVASGVGAPLSDIAYLYGTLRTQGRAYAMDIRQFAGRGIPIYEELAKVMGVAKSEVTALVSEGKVGFADVEKVFKNLTSSTGMYYNLMHQQSASLTGMISNLEDAWDTALNKIGTDNQDLFAGIIDNVTYMVEHFEDILRILKAVTIAYGTYKAAIVFNTLATKGYTGVALIDNTVRQAKLSLLKMDAALTGETAKQTQMMVAAQKAHVASLQQQLTAEEHSNLVRKLRIATIQELLTVQQQEYLSNLNITTSSANYEAVAMGVLNAEQRVALSKVDLTSKSAVYRAALEQEVATKVHNKAVTLDAMRTEVKAAAARVESAKQGAIASMQATEAARYELYWAKQSGKAHLITTAEKKLEAAQDNQALARKAALAAQTDFFAKKKALEAAATRQTASSTAVDTTAKAANAATTSLLTKVTTKATLATKALWAVMKKNPIGWIIGIGGALISLLTLFKNKKEEATDAMGQFQDTTKKEIDNLQTLFTILKNVSSGTKTHSEVVEKINAIAREYNVTLLEENANLDEQKKKYDELTVAIQQNTAEKIKAKYTEKALQEAQSEQEKALKTLTKEAGGAKYYSHTLQTSAGAQSVYLDSKAIQEASGAVWEAVESEAILATEKIKGLTGDAYTQAFEQLFNRVSGLVQKSTNATDKEMSGFNAHLRSYLKSVVDSSVKAQKQLDKVDAQLKEFYAPKENKVAESIDYTAMSFEELDKTVKDTQKEIDIINKKKVKVDTDNTRLTELLGILGQVNKVIDDKTVNLNTEAGISERIKQLSEERANVEINSTRYKVLTQTIQTLQAKLPKVTGAKELESATKDLKEKQKNADRQLEEDRIAIMEEGYEKKKAILAFQHKQALDQIDKEEKELAEARKKAGKGNLTAEEKDNFKERRTLATQQYNKAENKLFDDEIEYKKQQYELYFRWVKYMGQDVANAQFSTLLKGGNSYKEYVENQIKELKAKQASGTPLSEGESNHLIALNMQYDEITGAKSAMDSFKESISQAIDRAATLAEKIEVIAQAKEKLASGKSGLTNADDKAEASLFISEKEKETDKEIQDKVLTQYRTYEEQKLAIEKEFAMLKARAREENNSELLKKLEDGEKEALSTLNASFLMQSESWKNLFSDLDSLTVSEIDKLVKEIQEKMNTADLNLNPADLKAVLDKLDEAKQKVLDTNPFKALGSSLTAVFKKQQGGSKKTAKQIKTDWTNLGKATEGVFDFVNDAIDSCDVLGDAIGDNGKATIKMLQGITMAGIAMATAIATAEKGSVILTAISLALQAIQFIAHLFDDSAEIDKRIESIQKKIEKLERSFDRLQAAADKTYWVYSEEERREHQERLADLAREIQMLERRKKNAGRGDKRFTAEDKKRLDELRKLYREELEAGDDMFQLYERQTANIYTRIAEKEEQIRNERKKKKPDKGAILQYQNEIEDLYAEIDDLQYDMLQKLAGTDVQSAIDDFADALVDAYMQGEDAAKALADTSRNVLKKAVIDALKREFLAKGINDAILFLGKAMEDNDLSPEEMEEFKKMTEEAGNKFYSVLDSVGDWLKDIEELSEDPLSGAIASLSEETGGVIAGRLNAFIINQADQISIMRSVLIYQAQIATNTKVSAEELREIKSSLKRIESNGSMLSQGVA